MQNPSILSHVSIGVHDLDRSAAFYDAVMAALGGKRCFEHDGAVAYGRQFPEFWIAQPLDDGAPSVGNGTHFAFFAHSRAEVDAFHAAALKAGATDSGAPGPRPEYGEPYYGCFVRDPDGHKIEATFWDQEIAGTQAQTGRGAGDAMRGPSVGSPPVVMGDAKGREELLFGIFGQRGLGEMFDHAAGQV